MKEKWHLAYEVHRVFFGTAFLLLTCSCLRAMIRATNTTPLFTKSRISYAINAVLVFFTLSRALALLLHGYVNDEAILTVFALDEFLLNIGFPCLIAAYTRMIYPWLAYLKHRVRRVFNILIVQCYIFILAGIAGTTYDQHVSLYVKLILPSCSILCALCAFITYAKTFYSNSSNDIEKSNDLTVGIINTTSCETAANDMNERKGTTEENIVTVSISCIWIICVVVWGCIVSGNLKRWESDIYVESWYSWMYANVLRMIELGNAAIMSRLVQRVTLKQKFPLLM
ncbi:Hypothetical predicted protein [Paramuricea clavata]|uniref:Proline-rich transmembrane protein 3/4 domain-containing protein n=1 Tax=Paramuricea clavata TaxID=317549 RepID=A0A6S7GP85_PARCT|nr:Hypothetical predicted protein [Paramuricea clavata]